MINAKIRTSIVLTLGLILIAQMAFIPVLLSIIFAISIVCIWIFLNVSSHFQKRALFC